LEKLIEICLLGSGSEPIQHMEVSKNFHVFSSQSSDLRFLGSFLKDLTPQDMGYAELGGLPATAVIGFIGYGAAEINAYQVGGKIVLNNGFHRVYALRELGYKQLPILVQEIKNPSLEFPAQIFGVSSNYLLNHQRPVMVKDFFEPEFVIKFKVPRTIRTVKIRVATEQYEVPA
jgi:hypothetical protein